MSAVSGDSQAVYASKDAWLFSADYDSANTFPANDTVDWGDPWGGEWDPRGYTQDAITNTMSVDRGSIAVDQLIDDVLMPITGRDIRLKTILAEFTPDNLMTGFGQGDTATTAPTLTTKGYTDYSLLGSVQDAYRSWGVDFRKNWNAEPIRLLVHKGLAVGNVEFVMGSAEKNPNVPVEVKAIPDDSFSPAKIITIRDLSPMAAA